MNLSTFRTEIAAKLSLNTADAAELALIDQWINDGVAYIVGETESKVAIATATLTAGQADYELDANILRVLWIETNGGGGQHEIFPAGPTEIRERRLNAASVSPSGLYAIDGANLLMLWPTPASADTLTIQYVPRPTALSATADTPSEIPTEFHRLVTLYALWQGADYDDDETSSQGTRYQQQLELGMRQMRARIVKKKGRRLGRFTVSRRRGYRVHHTNDVYPE